MFKQLYLLTTKNYPIANYLKIVGTFNFLNEKYVVFFIGYKKYVYFPFSYINNLKLSQNNIIFKNIFSDKNGFKYLNLSFMFEKLKFFKLFFLTKNLIKQDNLRIQFFSKSKVFSFNTCYSIYILKTKLLKFRIFLNFKIGSYTKLLVDSNKLFLFFINFKSRFIFSFITSIKLISILKRLNLLNIPNFFKKFFIKFYNKKKIIL